MAFENFPVTGEPQQPVTQPPKRNFRNLMTGGLVVALLGTWGYIIYDKNQTKETIQQKDTVIATSSSQRDELQKELEDATMRYDMIKTSSANMEHSKDSVITKRDRDIADKQKKIKDLLERAKSDKGLLTEANTLISSLKNDIEGYKTSIEQLEGQKLVLTQEKETAIKQRDKVSQDYDSAKIVLQRKEEMIDIGSTLQATDFSITGIKNKNNGGEKETNTAKRVDKLRIAFDLAENRIAQTGPKDLFVSITAPDGTPVSGGGTFKSRDGVEITYTQKVTVNYTQGQRQAVNFDWIKNSPFQIGDYKIEIYHNGFKIGEGVIPLKKGGLFS